MGDGFRRYLRLKLKSTENQEGLGPLCIVGQMGRCRDISVQPERTEEEEEKSPPSPSMSIPGGGNHDSRAWSHTGVVSKALQSFGAPPLMTLDGNARASSGNRFLPSTPLCGWRALLKTCFETTFDQTLKLVWQYWLKSVVPILGRWRLSSSSFQLILGNQTGLNSSQFAQGGRENTNTSFSLTIVST